MTPRHGSRSRKHRQTRGWSGILALLPAVAGAQEAVVIRDVTVIPMTRSAPLPRHSVLIRGDRIVQVGRVDAVPVPAGAEVIDGRGMFLIPGLIEMHAHTSKSRALALPLYLRHGVTTVRDQGSEHAEVLAWRREIRAGSRTGPRLIVAGPYLEARSRIEQMRRDPPESRVEPFERARIPVGSPEEARRVVDSLARLELDHLKVRTIQDVATHRALAEAAGRHGLRLTGHAMFPSPSEFLASGQAGVDHNFPVSFWQAPAGERRAFHEELARRDIGVVPTLVTVVASLFGDTAYYRRLIEDSTATTHSQRPFLAAFLAQDWREQFEEVTPARQAAFRQLWPTLLRDVREMHAAGVRLMAGSDVAVLNVFPGWSLHDELALFVDSVGMTPLQALASATREPAEWLGLRDSVGTIAPGRKADLVLLARNPLEEIRNTRSIVAVVVGGRVFRQEHLAALESSVLARPERRVIDWRR